MLDDRIPVWPPDMSAILYGSISNPDWQVPAYGTSRLARSFSIDPSFAFGDAEPLVSLQRLTAAYLCLADKTVPSTQKRAELTVEKLVDILGTAEKGSAFLNSLPLGIAAPLREAIRTCQLSPPSHWRKEHYDLIGRRDLAFSVLGTQPELSQKGIAQSPETYMVGTCKSGYILAADLILEHPPTGDDRKSSRTGKICEHRRNRCGLWSRARSQGIY